MTLRHPTPLRTIALLAVALYAPATLFAGCGKDSAKDVSARANADVSREVGLAAGTSRKYLFTPAVAASLQKGAPNRKQAIADAATASEYTVRALAQARAAAKKDPKLKELAAKLQAAGASIGALTVVLRTGKTPPKSLLSGSLGTIQSVENALRDAGIPFQDRVATNLSGT